MANRENLLKMLAMKLGPERMQQMANQATQALMSKMPNLTPEQVAKIIKVLEYMLEHPDQYQNIVQKGMQTGAIQPGVMPPQFDPVKIGLILLAFYGIQSKMGGQGQQMQMADGGLARLNPQMMQQYLSRMRQRFPQFNERFNRGRVGFESPDILYGGGKRPPISNPGGVIGIEPPDILYGGNKQPPALGGKVGFESPDILYGSNPVKAYKAGGLHQAAQRVAAHGRHGDTMLAHITPREAAMLKAAGGSGTINPDTGLPEFFWDSIVGLFSDIGGFFTDAFNYVDSAISAANWGDIGIGALTGAATSALTGGNPLVGALTGGLGASPIATDLGNWIGGAGSLGSSLVNSIGAQNLGAGIIGGIGGGLSGQNPLLAGLMTGGQTAALNSLGLTSAAQGVSQLSQGMNPAAQLQQLAGGQLSGGPSPSDYYNTGAGANVIQGAASPGFPGPAQGGLQLGVAATGVSPEMAAAAAGGGMGAGAGAVQGAAQAAGGANTSGALFGADWMKLGTLGLAALKMFGGLSPQQASQEINKSPQLTKEQKEALNRPLTKYVASWGQSDYAAPGTPGYAQQQADLARGKEINWVRPTVVAAARGGHYSSGGGALSQISKLIEGEGSGRDDLINARLSDGEYVVDAETVALLGDGSNEEGGRRLDIMRERIRQHKGKKLSKGKISPNAKAPLQYMKGGLK